LKLSILIINKNELLWSSADNVILLVYPIKFAFSCLSYSGWIGSGTNQFGFNSVRLISGSSLHRVNKSSSQFGFDSGHIEFRVNSGHYSFGSVRFWVGLISDFGSKLVQLFLMSVRVWFRVVRFRSFGSGHFCQVYASPPLWLPSRDSALHLLTNPISIPEGESPSERARKWGWKKRREGIKQQHQKW